MLGILAIVTSLAVRSLDGLETQRRYEASLRGLQEISDAVLGSHDDRTADGSRTISGFVADMGRLPRATSRMIDGNNVLTLDELWTANGLAPFAMRRAFGSEIDLPDDSDNQVVATVGWRGPYVRIPLGAHTLRDGWGNAYISPISAPELVPRLLDADGNPLTASEQIIGRVLGLGANGQVGGEETYDNDEMLNLASRFRATLTGSVIVNPAGSEDEDETLAPVNLAQSVTIRVYGPNPSNAEQLSVIARWTGIFAENPLIWRIDASPSGSSVGPRKVRAYLHTTGDNVAANATRRSAVKEIIVSQGENVVNFKID